ncbi:hypothetical protein W1120610_148 [Cyanophage S-RIM12_W1_12_0610]|uniref:Uncharacterized protein n=1 Tax=Cyanophage S-RIM12 TaxID=1278402 RepID=A0A1D7SYU2_9CAUD|nr:hypothetical protein W1120610_148 [Cyanophage S-RIM12_W1_12_0610]
MAIFSIGNKCNERGTISKSQPNDKLSDSESIRRNRGASNKRQLWSRFKWTEFYNQRTRSSIPIHPDLHGSRGNKSDCNPKNNRSYQRNRYYKYLYPVIGLLIASPVSAADVGGVSATANPIANSSGSVTNQAIQVLQGPYITNQYGGGIACQGPTANITPFITHARSQKDPFEQYYMEPQYDNRDFQGQMVETQKVVKNFPWEPWYDDRSYTNSEGETVRAYEDGQDMTITTMEMMGDGVPDNPGSELWRKPVRTGDAINNSTSLGLSATLSFPLDGGLQERCKQAADTQIQMQQQMIANKRLDFEIARLKNCGQLMQQGISFHPRSPYYKVCADVVVQNVNTVKQHRHSIPSVSVPNVKPLSHGSDHAVPPSSQTQTIQGASYPVRSQSSLLPSSQSVSQPLTKDQQEALQAVQKSSQLQQLRR